MSTIGQKLSVLKSFFGWLVKEEVLLRDPTLKVKLPKKPKRLPKGLSIEELETVRDSCNTLRQRALIEVMYSTGCRLSEVASMNKNDINIRTMNLKVIGKGDKERVVYLSIKAYLQVKKYLKSRTDDCEALFITSKQPYRRLGNRAIQREIDKIETLSNIKKKLTPHVMRHTFANLSMDAGIELADLQHLMGHSNPFTTLVYSSVSEERKQQAFKKYHVM
jgi:site-specific recombinase XerD